MLPIGTPHANKGQMNWPPWLEALVVPNPSSFTNTISPNWSWSHLHQGCLFQPRNQHHNRNHDNAAPLLAFQVLERGGCRSEIKATFNCRHSQLISNGSLRPSKVISPICGRHIAMKYEVMMRFFFMTSHFF